MLFDQFVDGEFERAGIELFLQGNGDHDDLIVRIRLVSCHKILRLDYSTVSTVCVTCVWVGVDNAWKQEKLKARKMLENSAVPHTPCIRFVRRILQDCTKSTLLRFLVYRTNYPNDL